MAVSFAPSTQFQQWITRLRVSWMGRKAQAIMGAFAKVAGDLTYDWMLRANLEHLPEYASAQSVGFIASERQLDAGPQETTAQLASRDTQAAVLWQYAGTALGLLLALHFSGFDYAVIVQQNGLAFQLSLPLPPFPVISGQKWNPLANLVVTNTSQLAVALTPVAPATKTIPAGTNWWTSDSNTDFCSRFQVLFPGPNFPGSFTAYGTAVFTASDTAAVVWNNAFPDLTYHAQPGPATVTDGQGGVDVWLDSSTKTTTGITVRASAPFTGSVDVLAWQNGANPFADPHPADLARLQSVIMKWRPAKATCLGVYVLAQGKFAAWPVGTMSQMLGVPSTIVQLQGSF